MKTTEARIRRLVRDIIKESFSFDNYDKLTKDENLELRLMGHDKSHIDLNNNVALAKAFQYYSEVCDMPLFRGIYEPEVRILESIEPGDTFQLGRVTSYSENEGIGIKFAKRNVGCMVELVPGSKGFSLAGIMIQRYNAWEARDPYDFKMQDGEFQRHVAQKEAEWLMPYDTTYELLGVSERDGLTVYKIKTV